MAEKRVQLLDGAHRYYHRFSWGRDLYKFVAFVVMLCLVRLLLFLPLLMFLLQVLVLYRMLYLTDHAVLLCVLAREKAEDGP